MAHNLLLMPHHSYLSSITSCEEHIPLNLAYDTHFHHHFLTTGTSLPISLSLYISLSVFLSLSLSFFLSLRLSLSLSLCISLSICLSVSLFSSISLRPGISPRTMSMEPSSLTTDAVQTIRAWTTDDGLFCLQRQLLRWVGLVATLGSGCAMALTGTFSYATISILSSHFCSYSCPRLSLYSFCIISGPAAELGMTVGRLIGFRFLNSENAQRQLILAAAGTYSRRSFLFAMLL